MKKKIMWITGFIWGMTNCLHLTLDTPQKIDFTHKRVTMIETTIAHKLQEKSDLEQKLLQAQEPGNNDGTTAILQNGLSVVNAEIKNLRDSITVAQNSIKSLLVK
ncbi:hypothetical protein H0X06_04750 [Candidatus Dependentiae bacterium]|nr:hypothetical protein [Candidatus Dependentiae bacterium]